MPCSMIADAGSLETVDRHRKRVAMKHPWKWGECGRAETRKGRIHPHETHAAKSFSNSQMPREHQCLSNIADLAPDMDW